MKNKSFPQATKSIAKAKLDLKEWGYCLLKDAIPTDLNDELSKRLVEQANAEKKQKLAYEDGSKEKNGVNLITSKKVELIKEYGCFLIKEEFF